jgi:uncharacterized membrane protein YdjX (TVP38/TMEM64 family)
MNYGTYFSFYSSFILIIPLMHAALVALLLLRLRFQDLVARKTKGKKKKKKEKRKKKRKEGMSFNFTLIHRSERPCSVV